MYSKADAFSKPLHGLQLKSGSEMNTNSPGKIWAVKAKEIIILRPEPEALKYKLDAVNAPTELLDICVGSTGPFFADVEIVGTG